jgi:hypothetical protein
VPQDLFDFHAAMQPNHAYNWRRSSTATAKASIDLADLVRDREHIEHVLLRLRRSPRSRANQYASEAPFANPSRAGG